MSGPRGESAVFYVGRDRSFLVDCLAKKVEDSSERVLADGHGDGGSGIDRLHAADKSIGRSQGHAPDDIVTNVHGHFDGQIDTALLVDYFDRVKDMRQRIGFELAVHSRADYLYHFSNIFSHVAYSNICTLFFFVSGHPLSASAPETISSSSLVICPWRALL